MTSVVTVRPLCRADIPLLVGVLARAYGSERNYEWRLQSYLQMKAVATFVAELDGRPVGMVVGNDYGPLAYVSQMAVDPSLQRHGIGAQLMNALIAWVDARRFLATELDATPAGIALYARYAFVETDRTFVYASARNTFRACRMRPYAPADREALFAADAEAFGADRREVLGVLLDAAPASVVVEVQAGGVAGYAVAQIRPRLLGPVVASDPDIAARLIDAARVQLPVGHHISVPAANPAVAALLASRGYRAERSLAHMVRGRLPAADRHRLFARINLGQG